MYLFKKIYKIDEKYKLKYTEKCWNNSYTKKVEIGIFFYSKSKNLKRKKKNLILNFNSLVGRDSR